MRVLTKLLLMALSLLWAICLFSQSKRDANLDEVFARLSYHESGTVKSLCCLKEPPTNDQLKQFISAMQPPDICIAVSEGGYYRVVMNSQHLQGKMPNDKLQELKILLSSPDFRSLSGDHGGLLRQKAETFAAEIMQPSVAGVVRTQHLQWLNPDDNNPFPEPLSEVISWLKDFKPQGGKQFVYSEFSDVCPSRGFRLLQPSVATTTP